MKLNELELDNYQPDGNKITFVLSGEVLADAVDLDGQTLTISDQDEDIAVFAGYDVVGVYIEAGNTVVTAIRELDDSSKKAIEGIESNIAILAQKANSAVNDALTATQSVSELNSDMESLKQLVEEGVSGGGNEQVVNFAKMQVAAMNLTGETETVIASISTLLPEWMPDTVYKKGDSFQYDGRFWRVSQDTTSQSIYPPGTSESLYYEIVIAPDGIIVYRTCHGEYDAVQKGELRHYPDMDGPVYRSKVDNNAYSPDAYPQNWELVE